MRGTIPEERMEQIRSALPASFDLWEAMPPHWAAAEVVAGADRETFKALVRLWDGWHLLNEAHLALVEAAACKLWHEEFRIPPDTRAASYFCRFYLDDAALRLYASCEHLLKTIRQYWRLPRIARRKAIKGKRKMRPSLLEKVLNELRQKDPAHPVVEWLEALQRNPRWKECVAYRNDWVHNERPNIQLLGPPARSTATRTVFPSGGVAIQLGEEPCRQVRLQDLSEAVRGGYLALYEVYGRLVKLVASELAIRASAFSILAD